MKKNKVKDAFLDHLRKVPIVQVACEKVGVSRNSVYRWKNEDAEFRKAMETALGEGEELINDMSESQLISMIRDKNWNAISFWLRKRSPKFKDRIEVQVAPTQEELTPEQEETVREALRLASMDSITSPITETSHGTGSTPNTSDGNDGKGSEGTNGDH
ncbi:hypothetical protein KKH81_01720 [Patescibacteria group bacterium]|nr:hypothetical protein [Patescibacteria group bacterium]